MMIRQNGRSSTGISEASACGPEDGKITEWCSLSRPIVLIVGCYHFDLKHIAHGQRFSGTHRASSEFNCMDQLFRTPTP
jgi:hypothetical protein